MANRIQNGSNLRNVLGKFKFDLKQNLFIGKIPKLKFISLNRISINLWRDQLSRVDMSLLCDSCLWLKMMIYETEILEKISHLIIPKDCKVYITKKINYFLDVLESFFVLYNHFEYLSLNNFNNYWDNICFTQQGTINYVKTASQLIDNTSLSIEKKFVLACKNGLEDKIRDLLKLLPEDIIEKYSNNNTNDCLIRYWICYTKGELDKFYTFGVGFNYWNHLMIMAIYEEDQVAVQYIWEQISEENMHHLDYYMNVNLENDENIDICLYLFQQMNENNLNLKVDTIKLLLKKLEIVSQQDVFPRIETYIHDVIKSYEVFAAFEILLFCWHDKIISYYDYVTLWAELVIYFKDDIEKNFIELSTKILSSSMLERNDMISFQLLLGNCSPANKKILSGKNGIQYCVKLINIGGFGLLDKYLNDILEKEELISEWKKYIFDEGILELCIKQIVSSNYESINTFLIDYVPEDQISEFKNNLPFKNNADFIRCFSELFEFYDFKFLEKVKDFLFWCFEGNEEEIERFKSLVFDVDGDLYSDKREMFFEVLKELMEDCEWELAEKILKWMYFVPKDIERTTKEKLGR